jgi:hypothetical protein
MSDLALSARDPLFLVHHANVDRLWKRWLDQGGRTVPVNQPKWMNAKFTFFDEQGRGVEMSVKEVLETEDLGYRYDDDPPAVLLPKPGPLPEAKPLTTLAASTSDKPIDLGTSGPVRVTTDLGERAQKAMTEGRATLTLLVEGIRFVPADEEPMCYYEVYLDLPAEKAANFQDIHYAGNLVFAGLGLFGRQHLHHHGDERADKESEYLDGVRAFDVTEVVRNLHTRKLLRLDNLTVTFVLGGLIPVKVETPVTTPGVKARFDRVRLVSS